MKEIVLREINLKDPLTEQEITEHISTIKKDQADNASQIGKVKYLHWIAPLFFVGASVKLPNIMIGVLIASFILALFMAFLVYVVNQRGDNLLSEMDLNDYEFIDQESNPEHFKEYARWVACYPEIGAFDKAIKAMGREMLSAEYDLIDALIYEVVYHRDGKLPFLG